ncbi:MAG: FtsH protease activity modulator HflK [Thiomargarita sp.]|nr:FtsH protease activity modulator HflK [Thiomargarita sp.]
MAWNEPGGNDNGKKDDPWGNRKKEQGPPDLEDILQKIGEKFGGMFGGGGKDKKGSSNAGLSWTGLIVLAVIALVVWCGFGIYIIQPAEQGVVTRLGRYQETTLQGLNWHWPPPLEHVQKINVEEIRAITHKALMLTQDENIVVIELVVQYRVKNAENYLFKVSDPDGTLRQATESALREIVGGSKMDGVLTSERTRVAQETKILIQTIIDRYETGLIVSSVNMQNAQPPEPVQAAFADVIKAREDKERSENKADAYANEVVEKAKGTASQLREGAHAYKAQIIARSEGQTKRFLSVLKEYEKAPEVTRQRLYLETMESVLSNTSKILVDIQGGNNLMVLPLDRLLGNMGNDNNIPTSVTNPRTSQPKVRFTRPTGDNLRNRGER